MADLVMFDNLARQIDIARDVNILLKLHDSLELIRLASKQQGGSLILLNKAQKYKIIIEQKIGEEYAKLKDERKGQSQHKSKSSDNQTTSTTKQKAAKETGKNRDTLARWVKESQIPEKFLNLYEKECNEKGVEISQEGFLKFYKNIQKEKRKNEEKTERKESTERLDIRKGDFKEVLADVNNIDAIITDPPYPKKYIYCFSDLSKFASEHLKDGGFLVAYSGQYNLPEVITRLSEYLTYVWTFCLYHVGKKQIVNGVNIMCGWKPILIFSKGNKKMRFSAYDVVVSEEREKHSHAWQQSESGVSSLIEIFSKPGELIVDPFAGSGTFIKVAVEMGRVGIGAEID